MRIVSGRVRPDKEILTEALDVCCSLSPENLTWDGERPRFDVKRAYKALVARLEALGREYGKALTEDAVWNWRINGVKP